MTRSISYKMCIIFISALATTVFSQSNDISITPSEKIHYHNDVKPVLESRCVVCHGCYDAPCQIKMTSLEGIFRGGHKDNVYNMSRILSATPTRLNIDAENTEQWREKEFYTILPQDQDRSHSAFNAIQALENLVSTDNDLGLLYKSLALKQKEKLPPNSVLPKSIPVGVSKKHACPTSQEYSEFKKNKPNWGMPYGLPPLNLNDQNKILSWIEQGATSTSGPAISTHDKDQIEKWEALLNQKDNKSKLIARYIYEHLFLAAIYFEHKSKTEDYQFYRVVRSSTHIGQPVKIIATRRPFDNPKTDHFYYRIVPSNETRTSKNHLPYLLDSNRLAKWNTWFYQKNFTVDTLPSYDTRSAANPFLTFSSLPVNSRYEFLLDESRYFIMNFIKGPVCRGQVAVNVIRDHFWVFFVNPKHTDQQFSDEFLSQNFEQFKLPNSDSSEFTPLLLWSKYADKQKELNTAYQQYLIEHRYQISNLNEAFIWNGNNKNPNAALTIFRHFDNAQVEFGLVGGTPQTAWLIDYPLLERIYYLLVANYDVYGNVAHQVISRVYMDFLRMDGEKKLLQLLPKEQRLALRSNWYKGANDDAREYINYNVWDKENMQIFNYQVPPSKTQLLKRLNQHVARAIDHPLVIAQNNHSPLASLNYVQNKGFQHFADVSVLKVTSQHTHTYYTMIKNVVHKNVSTMFDENDQILHDKTHFVVLEGVWGSYPNAFYEVDTKQLNHFIEQVKQAQTKDHYLNIRKQYGIRRTSPKFWLYSDRLHEYLKTEKRHEYGVLDYNRLTRD